MVETTEKSARPIVKSLGGKTQLLPELLARVPEKIDWYYEPFAGGAALFFALAAEKRFKHAMIGDANVELVNMYKCVRDDVNEVLRHLRGHAAKHSEDHFYTQRAQLVGRTGPSAAARYIYLSKTCFNGLYRVNSSGDPNMPYGHYDNPKIVDAENLRAAARALEFVEIVADDFEYSLRRARRRDFAYFDPPYLPASPTANFAGYQAGGFGIEDTERLAETFRTFVRSGAHALLSNSDTPETRRIFKNPLWKIERVEARRNVNSKGNKRGVVGEILVSAPPITSKKGTIK